MIVCIIRFVLATWCWYLVVFDKLGTPLPQKVMLWGMGCLLLDSACQHWERYDNKVKAEVAAEAAKKKAS